MDFAIYVLRVNWRKFRVAVYRFDVKGFERLVKVEFVQTIRRQKAKERGEQIADAHFCDQTKRKNSVAIISLPQPEEKVRIVADDSPESRKP